MSKPSITNYPLAFYPGMFNLFSFSKCLNVLLVLPTLNIYGDFSNGVHLFPFRTEKLSPLAQMVLHLLVG